MRPVRILIITVATLLALFLLAIVALLLFVDPNAYRGRIQQAVLQHTGRPLTIGGKLELKVFPWLGLSIHEVTLGNPPGYGSEPFASVQSASIGVKLLPLLAHRVEVSRIEVSGLTANLISRGPTENNWKDLGEQHAGAEDSGSAAPKSHTPQRTQTAPGGSAPAGNTEGAASVGALDVSNATLVYRDEVKKSTVKIADLQIHTGRVSADPSGAGIEKLTVEGTYSAQAAGATPAAPLKFSLRAPQIALDSQQKLAPASVEARLGDLAVNLTIAGEKLSGDRLVSGGITIPKTAPRPLLQSLGVTPPVMRDSHTLSALALKANYRLTPSQLQISDLTLTLDDTTVTGRAGIDNLETSALGFDLQVNAINLDRYRPPAPESTAKAAPVGPQPPVPLPLDTLRKVDAHGTLHVGSATFSGLVFTDVLMPLAAKDGLVHLGPTRARLYGGSYNGDITLDARPVQAHLSLNEHLHGVDIAALLKAAFDSSRLSGHADANVAVAGTGNTDQALIRSLAGKIDMNVTKGALEGIDFALELQRADDLLKRQVPRQSSGPARTTFNTLRASATLDQGVLRNDDLQIETDFLKAHGGGTLNLTSEAIDYRLVTGFYKPPAGTPGKAAPAAALEVPLLITGTPAKPVVRPDIEALAKGQLRQEVQKRSEDLKKKLGEKLQGLFSH